MCAHAWQLVVILDAPVSIYSEQAQEPFTASRPRSHLQRAGPGAIYSEQAQEPFTASRPRSHLQRAGPGAIYSEQAQEPFTASRPRSHLQRAGPGALEKYLAKYKRGPSARARQHSVSLNIYDTFVRMLSMSHLMVAGKKRQAIVGRTL